MQEALRGFKNWRHGLLGRRLVSAWAIVLGFFALETVGAFYSVGADVSPFRAIFAGHAGTISKVLVSAYSRIFGLYFFLGTAIGLLDFVFGVRHRRTLYGLIFGYGLVYCLTYFPQIYNDLFLTCHGFAYLPVWLGPWAPRSLAATILGFLGMEGIRSGNFKGARALRSAMILAVLGSYFFGVQDFPAAVDISNARGVYGPRSPDARLKEARPNVIIISVDSLRGDFSLSDPGVSRDDALEKFIRESYRFKRVVASVAQTQPSFTALFTGNGPVQNQVRSLLSHRALDTDALLHGSLLEILKEAGYATSFLNDESDFVQFNPGKIFDRTLGGEKGLASVVLPSFFRDKLFYGFFNNMLGDAAFPELRYNAAFTPGYRLTDYTALVSGEIRRLAGERRPFLLTAHTCVIHWPGEQAYPYYPETPAPSMEPFSYSSPFGRNVAVLPDPERDDRIEYHREMYRNGIRRAKDQFIRPLLNQLQASGLLDNSVVILMSDHGENFGRPGPLPSAKFPEHGFSLVFGADSELATMMIHLPQAQGRVIDRTVGLVDLFPTILDYLGMHFPPVEGQSLLGLMHGLKSSESGAYYTETGAWPNRLFDEQFWAWDMIDPYISDFFEFFRIRHVQDADVVYLDPAQEPRVAIQKQRGLYQGDLKLVLYPTIYGTRAFLCDLAVDRGCDKNLVNEQPRRARAMLAQLLKIVQPDVGRGYFPPLALSAEGAGLPLEFAITDQELMSEAQHDPDRYQWVVLERAVELLYRWHDPKRAADELHWLSTEPGVAAALANSARKILGKISSANGSLPENLSAFLPPLNAPPIYEKMRVASPVERAEWMLFHAVPGTQNESRAYRQLGLAENENERETLRKWTKTLPAYGWIEQSYETEEWMGKTTIPIKDRIEQIWKVYDREKQYQLLGHLGIPFSRVYQLVKQTSATDGIVNLLRDLEGRVDQMPYSIVEQAYKDLASTLRLPSGVNTGLDLVRQVYSVLPDDLSRPSEILAIETGWAAALAARQLCASEIDSACREVRAFLEKDRFAGEWEALFSASERLPYDAGRGLAAIVADPNVPAIIRHFAATGGAADRSRFLLHAEPKKN